VTIPVAIREKLELKQGDRVAFVRIGDDVFMRPVKDTLLDEMGTIPVDGPQDIEKIRVEKKRREGRNGGVDRLRQNCA
jgi:AbrB family looped-hinge helix DNA binding protein